MTEHDTMLTMFDAGFTREEALDARIATLRQREETAKKERIALEANRDTAYASLWALPRRGTGVEERARAQITVGGQGETPTAHLTEH